ncbi:alkaline phosphatase D family protein [Nocardiopsis lucentensis]|uniref:alkaline phosphatase D family protein n=1 Tax=Nocardiopsis lucentensis TaxID=53441 RepID=UPI0004756AC6|nr:alkaline phosphatase D family protein [Nocardiopsis lucentensis]
MTVSLRLGPLLRHVDPTSATVWVETDAPCRARILVDGREAASAPTFTVHGHHYAVCELTGLQPGSRLPYEVLLDDTPVWPEPDSPLPPSVVRTPAPDAPTRLLYGSCHTPTGDSPEGLVRHGPDMLRATARRLAREPVEDNLLLLLIGDQVYADEVQEPMRELLRRVREEDPADGAPDDEVVRYDEYAELYRQAWSDPQVRWLLSTVPTLMVFDDHDIRDDWNTSAAWRRAMDALPWWRTRITSGLGAYWVYQHLGNLSPADRDADPVWARIRDRGSDAGDVLDAFAWRAHDEPSSYRWSHRVDAGSVRVLVTDTRCGRALGGQEGPERSILGPDGHAWLDAHLTGGHEHVVVASTVPVLLPPAVQHLEAWNEAVCEGAWGGWARGPAERVRQALDLEHWGAFQHSFRRLGEGVRALCGGERGPAPSTVLFLSGDVHFSYLARTDGAEGDLPAGSPGGAAPAPDERRTRVAQLVSSPLCNQLPLPLRRSARLSASWPFTAAGRVLTWLARVPRPWLRWRLDGPPYFGNTIGEVVFDGPDAEAVWYHCPEAGQDVLPHVYRRVAV